MWTRTHRCDGVAAPPTGDPRIHLRPVRRAGLTVVPLTRRPRGVQAYKVIYPPAGGRGATTLQNHEGYEWNAPTSHPQRLRPTDLDRELLASSTNL